MGAREEEAGVGGRLKFNLYQYAKQTSALTTVGQFPTTDTLVDPDQIRKISFQTLPLQPRLAFPLAFPPYQSFVKE